MKEFRSLVIDLYKGIIFLYFSQEKKVFILNNLDHVIYGIISGLREESELIYLFETIKFYIIMNSGLLLSVTVHKFS